MSIVQRDQLLHSQIGHRRLIASFHCRVDFAAVHSERLFDRAANRFVDFDYEDTHRSKLRTLFVLVGFGFGSIQHAKRCGTRREEDEK